MYTLKSYVEERVPAWEECKVCKGERSYELGVATFACSCNQGGTWHPMVITGGWDGKDPMLSNKSGYVYLVDDSSPTYEQAKSSFLVRRWGVCVQCKGHRAQNACDITCDICKCEDCHKDADGKPTGAEPGTAGEWEVE